MSRVAHPNIVTVLAVGEHGGRTFVAREYVEGTSLRHWLAEKPRSRLDVLAVLLAAGEGLAAAHAAGILHRNVTPEAVLRVGADGRRALTDFGLARKDGPVERPSTEDITLDGAKLAAASAYVAPEQISGQRVGAAAKSVRVRGGRLRGAASAVDPNRDTAGFARCCFARSRPIRPHDFRRSVRCSSRWGALIASARTRSPARSSRPARSRQSPRAARVALREVAAVEQQRTRARAARRSSRGRAGSRAPT